MHESAGIAEGREAHVAVLKAHGAYPNAKLQIRLLNASGPILRPGQPVKTAQ
jgi:hypothetical protein